MIGTGPFAAPRAWSGTVHALDEDNLDVLDLDPIDRVAAADANTALQDASAANYAEALRADPIKLARKIVAACRASTNRRLALQRIIEEGNAHEGGWDGDGLQLPSLELLRDIDTRWSSTFLMIDRLILLWPVSLSMTTSPGRPALDLTSWSSMQAVKHLLQEEQLLELILSDWEMQVLLDIRYFLRIPHFVQSRLSSTHATSAAMVLPVYERLVKKLRKARTVRPRIAHGIDASISALEKYLAFTRTTRAYAYAMGTSFDCSSCIGIFTSSLVVNPSIKFSWLQAHWEEHEYAAARKWITEAVSCIYAGRGGSILMTILAFPQMLQYRKAARIKPVLTVDPPTTLPSSQASSSQASSTAGSVAVANPAWDDLDLDGIFSGEDGGDAPSPEVTDSESGSEARIAAEDLRAVEDELARYSAEGRLTDRDLDILAYWTVQHFFLFRNPDLTTMHPQLGP